jgi:uncharacterized membrane protein YdjX (TVP38/TMEM64 family)
VASTPGFPETAGSPEARERRLPPRAARHAALFVVLLAAGGLAALLVDLPDVHALRARLADSGPAGWTVLLVGLALATLAPVPRAALSLLAGVLAGFWGGLALALGSGVLGALAGFALARWLGREAVTRLTGPRLAQADALLTRRGAVAVMTGRLIPIAPFTLVSYAAGLSGIRPRDYLVGSSLGLVPGTILHVAVGSSVGAAGDGPGLLLSLVPLAAAALAVLVVHRWRSRRQRPPLTSPQAA